jgi:hypothetical protein
MSDLGQSRHFGRVAVTSGPPPIPDILSAHRHVSKVPTADIPKLIPSFRPVHAGVAATAP